MPNTPLSPTNLFSNKSYRPTINNYQMKTHTRELLLFSCLLAVICIYIYIIAQWQLPFSWINTRDPEQTGIHQHSKHVHTHILLYIPWDVCEICDCDLQKCRDMPQRVTGSQCPSPSLVPHWSPSVLYTQTHTHTFPFDSHPVAICVLASHWLHCRHFFVWEYILWENTIYVFLHQSLYVTVCYLPYEFMLGNYELCSWLDK